ncbi:MAG: hypothetical protein L0099_07260 [Acidobacteria bacterium]|nr:hypothetical protein [Acidobacteriota bacterium]
MYDLWATAALGTIQEADLSSTMRPVSNGTSLSDAPTSPSPGQWYWSRIDQLMFVFHDVIDGTGVSQWLAIGPDRFETACLAEAPIPAGWPVDLVYDRRVRPASAAQNIPLGINQSLINISTPTAQSSEAPTSASGTWIRVGVDGIMWGAWHNASAVGASPAVVTTSAAADWIIIDEYADRAPNLGGGVNAVSVVRDPIGLMLMDANTTQVQSVTHYYLKFIYTGRRRFKGV